MTAKRLAAVPLLILMTAAVATRARAEEPFSATGVTPPASDNEPGPVTDTPPGDVGPWTNSVRRPAYANLLGTRAVTPLLDNGLGQSALSFSGYFWQDGGYMLTDNEQVGLPNQKASYMQGRLLFRVEYQRTLVGDLFAAARAEAIFFENEYTKSQYEAHSNEVFVKLGQKRWDVQVGRFYPFLVYYRGLGVDLYTPEESGAAGNLPPLYWVNAAWKLFDEPGQLALHWFPVDGLGFELSGVYGQEGTSGLNTFAVRPAVDWKLGGLELVGAFEYFRQSPQRNDFKVERTQYGAGARLQYTFWLMTAGVEGAYANAEKVNINEELDGAESFDRLSVGGFVDFYLWNEVLSAGLHRTADKRLNHDKPEQYQGYLAWVHRLPVRGASLKLVYGIARGTVDDETAHVKFENSMQSIRLRLQYLFQ